MKLFRYSHMTPYERYAFKELELWQAKMQKRPGLFSKISKRVQTKLNGYIPEKIHSLITAAIKNMVKGVLYGAKHITVVPQTNLSLADTEQLVDKKIKNYRTSASIEGGITGAGGIISGLADFPILMAIKIKLLFDIAALYGFDVKDYKERVYILHIFELAFSSDEQRNNTYRKLQDWEINKVHLPDDMETFDWRSFQQEYRDYIDIAKMAQLVPVIGAPVGAIVNYRLIKKLGITAKNAYRMRVLNIEEN